MSNKLKWINHYYHIHQWILRWWRNLMHRHDLWRRVCIVVALLLWWLLNDHRRLLLWLLVNIGHVNVGSTKIAAANQVADERLIFGSQ